MAAGQSKEYLVKASCLSKFTRYINWSNRQDIGHLSQPFVIGVVGEGDLNQALRKLYTTRRILNKPVSIRKISSIQEAKSCHILYLLDDCKRDLYAYIQLCETHQILLVSEHPGYAKKGCHINFYLSKEGKVNFEINVSSLRKSDFKIDLLLIEAGTIVKSK